MQTNRRPPIWGSNGTDDASSSVDLLTSKASNAESTLLKSQMVELKSTLRAHKIDRIYSIFYDQEKEPRQEIDFSANATRLLRMKTLRIKSPVSATQNIVGGRNLEAFGSAYEEAKRKLQERKIKAKSAFTIASKARLAKLKKTLDHLKNFAKLSKFQELALKLNAKLKNEVLGKTLIMMKLCRKKPAVEFFFEKFRTMARPDLMNGFTKLISLLPRTYKRLHKRNTETLALKLGQVLQRNLMSFAFKSIDKTGQDRVFKASHTYKKINAFGKLAKHRKRRRAFRKIFFFWASKTIFKKLKTNWTRKWMEIGFERVVNSLEELWAKRLFNRLLVYRRNKNTLASTGHGISDQDPQDQISLQKIVAIRQKHQKNRSGGLSVGGDRSGTNYGGAVPTPQLSSRPGVSPRSTFGN